MRTPEIFPSSNDAATILSKDLPYAAPIEAGDFTITRPSVMYDIFKQYGRGTVVPEQEFYYPEFSGYCDTTLVQLSRNPTESASHMLVLGNLATGELEYGELEDVIEISRHQDISHLSAEDQAILRKYIIDEKLRDFPNLHGYTEIVGVEHEICASVDSIKLNGQGVMDFVELDTAIYYCRKGLADAALRSL